MKAFVDKLIERLEELKTEAFDKWDGGASHRAYSKSIKIVNELAEEHNGSWISCSERLPETNENVLCWAKSTARGGDVCFVGSCHNGFWFLQSSDNTHSFPGQYEVIAWQPLPAPYKKVVQNE